MNRRSFLKASGLALLSLSAFPQTKEESKYIGNIEDSKFYNTWIATPTFYDGRIISSSKNASKAAEAAQRKGFDEPLVIYNRDPTESDCPSVF